MENEAVADEILALLEQLLQVAGPEGTLEFLRVGLEEMSGMGGEMPPEPEMMSPGGPSAMPPMGKRNALAQ
jgi:hypothetical protein